MEWTNKETEKLVDLFQTTECLWKTTLPSYSDRNERTKALSMIASEFKTTGL
jgi:hypothetical protein